MRQHNVEQNTPEWLNIRLGKPTASSFNQLVTGTGKVSTQLEKYACQLAAEMYARKSLRSFENEWTERGHELEESALEEYAIIHNEPFLRVGFITDDKERYGASPDALVGDSGMVEVKSLKTENHVAMLLYHKKTGKIKPDYIPQLQGQLMICERDWVDIIFYHPDLPSLIVRHTSDTALQQLLKERLEEVITRRDEIITVLSNA